MKNIVLELSRLVLVAALLIFCVAGCNNGNSGGESPDAADNSSPAPAAANPGGNPAANPGDQADNDPPPGGAGAQQWVTDQLKEVKNAGGDTIGDATEWASDTFDSLKQSGLTTADNAKEWVTSDFANMYAWEYKIVPTDDDPGAMEKALNELGKNGWECFHVQPDSDGQPNFYFKKHKRSYLKQVPMKDLLKLIPLMGGDGE